MQVRTPALEMRLSRSMACTNASVTLDVLARITPPYPENALTRPPINLGLVIDRSGSMGERGKIEYAIKAAVFAVQQLLPTDRVSVTFYDNVIETPVPSTLATDKQTIIRAIESARARGGTNLHGGWQNGITQVRAFLQKNGVNRVLLLSDGLANEGVTDHNQISQAVKDAALAGATTTTIGLGAHYDEHLMLKIAQSGTGNYYFVNDPVSFQDIFQSELHGLMNLAGRNVSLGIQGTEGVSIVDQLNDFERLPTGNYKLPEMVAGVPLLAVFRLNVNPTTSTGNLCTVRLAWDDPTLLTRQSKKIDIPLNSPVPLETWNSLPTDTEVAQQVGLLIGARAQREYSQAIDRGDIAEARKVMERNLQNLSALPPSLEILEELEYLQGTLAVAEIDQFEAKKRGHYRSSARQSSLLRKMGQIPDDNPPTTPPSPPGTQ